MRSPFAESRRRPGQAPEDLTDYDQVGEPVYIIGLGWFQPNDGRTDEDIDGVFAAVVSAERAGEARDKRNQERRARRTRRPKRDRPKPERVYRGVTLGLRFVVFRRDSYRCRICGRDAGDGVKLEVDHIKAVSKGGLTSLSNLWTLCWDCNRGKRAHDL